MDEFMFRGSQRFDTLQIQLGLVASRSRDLFHQCSEQSKALILQGWNSSKCIELQEVTRKIWHHIIEYAQILHSKVQFYTDPRRLYLNVIEVLRRNWTMKDIYLGFSCFLVGGMVGIAIGLAIRKNDTLTRYMHAIQCRYYLGPESVTVTVDAEAPHYFQDNEILVDVKAASVQIVDTYICNGYGRILRNILRKYYENSKSDLPVILGRDCTGIVTDIGKNVTRIEVGDEVWLTVPFWAQGTMCQTVAIPEIRVARKPKNIGFEGACSVPYAGCLALSALEKSNVTFENAQEKRLLVHKGCTPVGCVLIQILKHWGADVTSTCNKRALPVAKALGSDDVIIIDENDSNSEMGYKSLVKELELREKYDVIILTADCCVSIEQLHNFCRSKDSIIVSTLPCKLDSDSYGFFRRFLLRLYIWFQWRLEVFSGVSLNRYDEAHMCHSALDQLASLVKNGHLQTVVDKVFQPQDIDMAICHIESSDSIGSTVITFR
ncbi:hypothetical protein WA026_002183 [Henosepilachna vigintioctopunctata]|uniref:Enoyl reductase (ER) domain-containing protein n=1 Tax=Henosepilachna vigintioctopunctata TaxID=420089 RepID=A0AAW1TZ15_9CUCU